MATSSGLTLELNNYGSFKKNLQTLDNIIKDLDNKIDDVKNSVDKLEGSLKKLTGLKGLAALANNLTKIGTAIGAFSTTGSNKFFSTDLTAFVKVLDSGLSQLAKIDAKSLKPAISALNSLRNFIKLFKDINSEFEKSISGVAAGPFGRRFAALFEGKKNTDALKGVKSFVKIISDAISSFETIRNPQKLKSASTAIDAIGSFINTINELSSKTKGSRSLINSSIREIKGIGKFAAIISGALSAFDKIRRPENIQVAAHAIESIGTIVNAFKGIPIGGVFNSDRLSKFVKGIRPLTKILADALSSFDKIKSPAGVLVAGRAIRSISEIITSLAELQKIRLTNADALINRNSGLLKTLQGIRPFVKILTQALSGFDKIPNPEKILSVGLAIQAIAKALPALQSISDKKGFGKEIKNNIAPAIRELGKALDSVAKKTRNVERIETLTVAFERLSRSFTRFAAVNFKGNGKEIAQGINGVIDAIEDGFQQGNLEKALLQAGEGSGKSFLKGIRKSLGIASPSREMEKVAKFAIQGFSNGLSSLADLGVNIAKSFMTGFARTINFLFNDVIRQIGQKVTELGQRISQIGQSVTQSGRSALQTGVSNITAGGIFGFVQGENIGLAATFDQILNQIRVFGDLSQDELAKVSDAVLKFSADTIFDPTQSVNAFLNLQKAGLSAADALATLPRVGELAAAGNIGLERATAIAIGTMKTFNLTLEDQTRIADAYVRAANNSTASVEDLAQGIENVGPLADAFGISLEQTVAILALFNERGIKSAEAGTQLKSLLTNLSRPTEDVTALFQELGVSLADDTGRIKDFNTILNELNAAMNETKTVTFQANNLTAEQTRQLELAQNALAAAARQQFLYQEGLSTGALGRNAEQQLERYQQVQVNAQNTIAEILGSQAEAETITQEITRTQFENFQTISQLAGSFGQSGLTILLSEGENAINNFVDEMNTLPPAAEIAAELMDTFAGTIDSAKGSVQTLVIKAFIPLFKILNPLVKSFIKVVNAIASLPEEVLGLAAGVGLLVAVFTTLLGVGQVLFGLFAINIGGALTIVGTGIAAIGSILSLSFLPALLAVTVALGAMASAIAVIGIGSAIGLFAVVKAIDDIKNNTRNAGDAFDNLKASASGLIGDITALGASFLEFVGHAIGLRDNVDGAGKKLENVTDGPLAKFINKISTGINEVRDFVKELDAFFDFYNEIITGPEITETIVDPRGNKVGELNDEIGELYRNLDRINRLGIGGEQKQAVEERIEALERERSAVQNQANLDRDLMDGARNRSRTVQKDFTKIQLAVKRFSQTSIFKRLFGDDDGSVEKAIAYVGIIEDRVNAIFNGVERITDAFSLIFAGRPIDALKEIQKGIGEIAVALIGFGEDLFGFNLSDEIEGKLLAGDFAGVALSVISSLFTAIGNAALDNIGLITSTLITSGVSIPLRILDALGFIDSEKALNVVKVFSANVGSEVQKIIDGFRGQGDYADDFKQFKDDVSGFIDDIANNPNVEKAIEFAGKIGDALVGIASESNIGKEFEGLMKSVEEFAANPSVQKAGKLLFDIAVEIAKFSAVGIGALLLVGFTFAINALESGLSLLASTFEGLEGFIEFVDGLSSGDGQKAANGLVLMGNALSDILKTTLMFPVKIAEDILSFLNDAGIVKNDGLTAFTDALELLPLIAEGVFLKLKLAFLGVAVDIAESVNGLLGGIAGVAGTFGIEVPDLINVDSLRENLEDAKAELDEFSKSDEATVEVAVVPVTDSATVNSSGGFGGTPNEPIFGRSLAYLDVGKDAADGIAEGINQNVPTVEEAASNLGVSFLDSLRAILLIQSPSQATMGYGQQLVLGMSLGILTSTPLLDGPIALMNAKVQSLGQNVLAVSQLMAFGFTMAANAVQLSISRMVTSLNQLNASLSGVGGSGASINIPLFGGVPGRASGGPVRGGQMYEVTEPRSGIPNPEMLQVGNRNFMIPPANGFVKPMQQGIGGGSSSNRVEQNVYVNVESGANGVDLNAVYNAAKRGQEDANKNVRPFNERARMRGAY